MSAESWVNPGDNLENFNTSQPWPDQYTIVDGVEHTYPARQNYTYGNRSLPAARSREELVDAVTDNATVILVGETGSGKTTQGLQALHEAGIASKIIQTQPRILLARNTCYRVRKELSYAQHDPEFGQTLVGYATGSESDLHPDNKMIVATHGKALRWLVNHMSEYKDSIVMADEIHLREFEADLLMALCAKNGIKLVLASATMNADRISEVYRQRDGNPAPIVRVHHRPFETTEIEGGDLVEDIAIHGSKKDSMIFMTGRKNINALLGKAVRKMTARTNAMPLHGEQTKLQQQAVFDKSKGVRTIFSTNVGEMGVTPDVDVVFNPGFERANVLIDGVETLTERPASRAKNTQRAGRTGRTRAGLVVYGSKMDGYPKLPPRDHLPEFDAPDIQTGRVDGGLLQLAVNGETLYSLPLPDLPSHDEIERAQARLRRYGAFDTNNQLTETGVKMSHLPFDPGFARSFVEAERYAAEIPDLKVQMAALAAVQQAQGIVTTGNDHTGWRTVVPSESISDPIHALKVFIWAMDEARTKEELHQKGIVEPKLARARETFEAVCRAEGLDGGQLHEPAGADELKAIIACLISGAEEAFVRQGRDTYIDVRGERRYVQSSAMVGKAKILIGSPWNLQTYRKERLHMSRHIVSPTAVTRDQLEQYAPHRCTYGINGYAMDSRGIITAKQALYFDGAYVDDMKHVGAEPCEALRDYIVDCLFDKSLTHKKDLPQNVISFCKQIAEIRYQEHKVDFDLEIEKRLNALADTIKQTLPATIMTLQDIDAVLDTSMLAEIVNADEYAEIEARSPDMITIAAPDDAMIAIPVEYYRNQVRLTFTKDQLDYLPESFPEFAGRDVKIRIGGRSRLMTIEQAFERALHPSRAHWRNTVRETEVPPHQRAVKDENYENWNGALVKIPRDVETTPLGLYRRAQHKA